MLVIAPAKYKFLQAGRPLTITTNTSHYHKGRTYALGFNHKHTICRVLITHKTQDTLTIQLAQEPIRLLAQASQYGYITVDPYHPDTTRAVWHEPEPVDQHDLERITADARERWEQQTHGETIRRRGRSIAIQLKEAARRGDLTAFQELGTQLLAISSYAGTAGTALAV